MSDARKDYAVRPETAWLIGITLLGAFARLYELADCSLWYDECASLYLGRYVSHPWQLFNSVNNTEAPLNAILTWAWYHLVRLFTDFPVTSWQNDFAIRLLPCLLSTATIPMLYCLVKKLLDDSWTALLAGFLFAISPFYIYYGQELRVYAFIVPAALVTMYIMLRALEGGGPRYWVGLTLGLTVLLYSHFFSVWTIFTFSVYFILLWPFDRKHIGKWTLANAAGLVLMAPGLLLAYEMNKMVQTIVYKWSDPPTAKTMLVTFKLFFAGYGPTAWAYWPLFGLAAALHFLGLAALAARRWRAAVFVAVFTWVPLVGNVLLWASRDFSFYEHRIFVLSGVVAMIGVAAGIRALPLLPLRAGVLAVWMLFTLPMLRDLYQHRLHPLPLHRIGLSDKVDFRDAAAYIEANWQEGDLTVVPHHFFIYSLHHYLTKPHVRIGMDMHQYREHLKAFSHKELSDNHGLAPLVKEEATKDAKRLWYLESHGTTFEWKPETEPIRAWLDANWKKSEVQEFDGLTLVLYTRPQAAN